MENKVIVSLLNEDGDHPIEKAYSLVEQWNDIEYQLDVPEIRKKAEGTKERILAFLETFKNDSNLNHIQRLRGMFRAETKRYSFIDLFDRGFWFDAP